MIVLPVILPVADGAYLEAAAFAQGEEAAAWAAITRGRGRFVDVAPHNSRKRPAQWAATASSAKASSMPTRASCSMAASNCAASNRSNQARNRAGSSRGSCSTAFSRSSAVVTGERIPSLCRCRKAFGNRTKRLTRGERLPGQPERATAPQPPAPDRRPGSRGHSRAGCRPRGWRRRNSPTACGCGRGSRARGSSPGSALTGRKRRRR
ncbi:hypothetical protein ACVILH_005210 [Bradyrhizobium sp. USDA 4353]